MIDRPAAESREPLPEYRRGEFGRGPRITQIGAGAAGGKAHGLVTAHQLLSGDDAPPAPRGVRVEVPRSVVLGTDVFDAFMTRNQLWAALPEAPAAPPARLFEKASLPTEIIGDLRALCDETQGRPLAVRSSSQLEDALAHPFAGVYATKMTPNHQHAGDQRFRRLTEAIKCVFASCFSASARAYRAAIGAEDADEKMAVLIQEVVGARHGARFYPDLSVVARSFAAYRFGRAAPEDGVVNLAAGLGRTIVEGGKCWVYSPKHPRAPAPFGSIRELLDVTQTDLWAVNMGPGAHYDPLAETEHLVSVPLKTAEDDGVLGRLASTYDPGRDRVVPGLAGQGPRVLDFASILQHREPPLNDALRALLERCEARLGAAVEIELASVLAPDGEDEARLAFLQMRPMKVLDGEFEVPPPDAPETLAHSASALGNAHLEHIEDVVYVDPERFAFEHSRKIATELREVNQSLSEAGRDYLLIGAGRWGSSDPWLGVPVQWSDISRAKVIVESHGGAVHVDPSQGAHFFHNLLSFEVAYFTVPSGHPGDVDWAFLRARPAAWEGELVRHVRLDAPLEVWVDARTGLGAIHRGRGSGS